MTNNLITIPARRLLATFGYNFPAWANTTPFTYQDGLTASKLLEEIIKYIDGTLVPYIDEEMSKVVEAWRDTLTEALGKIDEAVEGIDELAAQVGVNASAAAESARLAAEYAATAGNVSDEGVAKHFAKGKKTRKAVDDLYEVKSGSTLDEMGAEPVSGADPTQWADATKAFNDAIVANHRGITPITKENWSVQGGVIDRAARVKGHGAYSSRFVDGVGSYGGPTLHVKSAGSEPVITAQSRNVALEDFMIAGNAKRRMAIRTLYGMEHRYDNVRVVNIPGPAVELIGMQNATIDDFWLDNCGTLLDPAMFIASAPPLPDTTGRRTNNLRFNRLTYERCAGTAISIAAPRPTYDANGNFLGYEGNDPQIHWAEYIEFFEMHGENPLDNGGVYTTVPANLLGSVRHVTYRDCMMYISGSAPILRHVQMLPGTDGDGGSIKILGGVWHGGRVNGNEDNRPDYLIDLVSGDNFYVGGGANFSRYKVAAIHIGPNYGPNVQIDSDVYFSGVAVFDERPLDKRLPYVRARGTLGVARVQGLAPAAPLTVTPAGSFTGVSLVGASDLKGTLNFTTGTGVPAAGTILATIKLDRPVDLSKEPVAFASQLLGPEGAQFYWAFSGTGVNGTNLNLRHRGTLSPSTAYRVTYVNFN